MLHRIASGISVVLLFVTPPASASDGVPDTNNAHPAAGFYYVAYRLSDGTVETLGGCSGTLIAGNVFLTAGHCSLYDSRLLVEDAAYASAKAWVTFDPVALENDFRCFLQDIGHPGAGALPCDRDALSDPTPTFHRARSTGITHPDYPVLRRLGNGSLSIQEPLTPNNTDLGVLLLEQPIGDIAPLATAPLHHLDHLDASAFSLLGVGYGLDHHKFIPARPDQPGGDGPTNFVSEYGIRRIADVGTIRMITSARITPTQRNARGEDSVCYWDSGSPLLLVRNGVVIPTVVGVLTGGALWCMGAYDPYQRVDTASSIAFLDCVKSATTARDACRCGAEEALGLCDGL